jgi:hypothetical protein
MWGQRCEKTARSALEVVRHWQQAACNVCSEVREDSKVSYAGGAAADSWQCGFWFGSGWLTMYVQRCEKTASEVVVQRTQAMWGQRCEKRARSASVVVRQQTVGSVCSEV